MLGYGAVTKFTCDGFFAGHISHEIRDGVDLSLTCLLLVGCGRDEKCGYAAVALLTFRRASDWCARVIRTLSFVVFLRRNLAKGW